MKNSHVSRLTIVIVLSALSIGMVVGVAATSVVGASSTNPVDGLRFMGLTRIQAEGKFRVNTFHCDKFLCWGPNLTNKSDGSGPKFYEVLSDTGFIDEYGQRLHSGSDYNQALAQLRIGLPADVKFQVKWLESSNGDRCEFVDATSKDLALVMGHHDPKGVIGIELSSGVNANLHVFYSPNNIEDAYASVVWITRGTGC